MMTEQLLEMLNKLEDTLATEADVITWGSPVPAFGNLQTARVATMGLNPSNREFVDEKGNELSGNNRRFHTLNSLGIPSWSDTEQSHLNSILECCKEYFNRNPYDTWFKRLDNLISGTAMSYYFPSGQACHLDLIPYATSSKWTDLSLEQKKILFEISGDTLALLLNSSQVELLILNGKTVVDNLKKIGVIDFEIVHMPEWTLPRKNNEGVPGFAYKGYITEIGGTKLTRKIMVLGYNHNIQSSFGVTTEVQNSIRKWISENSKNLFHETKRY